MDRGYLDFDVTIVSEGDGYTARIVPGPGRSMTTSFVLPFSPTELAQFMVAVGPHQIASRRLVPAAARVDDVREYGKRLGDALLAGPVAAAFRERLAAVTSEGRDLRLRLRLDAAPELEPIPWEYLYDTRLDRFLTLSKETPIVRLVDSLDPSPVVMVEPPLRVLVLISSPSDMPPLAVEREEQLLRATTGDLVNGGQLEIVVLEEATLTRLQTALLDDFHVLHFIGHGGFDRGAQEGVLVLEREDGTSHRISGSRLGTLLHDARSLQLAVLNSCEGARSSGRDAFSGVGQALVRQSLPAVVAMQTEISDRAALVFSHELYWFLTRGLDIDAAICEVRKAMAISDEASEWGTAVLLRSGAEQPFAFTTAAKAVRPAPEVRWESLYSAAESALTAHAPATALPLLEQIASEKPDYRNVKALLEHVRTQASAATTDTAHARAIPLRTRTPTMPQPPHKGERPINAHRLRRRMTGRIIRLLLYAMAIGTLWLGWRMLPTLVQRVTPFVEAACGTTSAATKGRTTFTVGCAPLAPTVDGDFDDWRSVPGHPIDAAVDPVGASHAGFGAEWQALWNKNALFLHVKVRDPEIRAVQGPGPIGYWQGDGVSLELGPDARRLRPTGGLRPGKDFQVLIGLVDDSDLRATAALAEPANRTFGSVTRHPDIAVVRRDIDGGYELEAAVPWRSLGLTIAPSRGTVFSANINVSDATSPTRKWGLRTMISSNPAGDKQAQSHPGLWQTLLLADSS
jgi:hypothetical protein